MHRTRLDRWGPTGLSGVSYPYNHGFSRRLVCSTRPEQAFRIGWNGTGRRFAGVRPVNRPLAAETFRSAMICEGNFFATTNKTARSTDRTSSAILLRVLLGERCDRMTVAEHII